MPSVASTTHAEIVPAEAVDGAYFTTLRHRRAGAAASFSRMTMRRAHAWRC